VGVSLEVCQKAVRPVAAAADLAAAASWCPGVAMERRLQCVRATRRRGLLFSPDGTSRTGPVHGGLILAAVGDRAGAEPVHETSGSSGATCATSAFPDGSADVVTGLRPSQRARPSANRRRGPPGASRRLSARSSTFSNRRVPSCGTCSTLCAQLVRVWDASSTVHTRDHGYIADGCGVADRNRFAGDLPGTNARMVTCRRFFLRESRDSLSCVRSDGTPSFPAPP